MARFLLEAKWLGYSSSQDRVCHREITTDAKLADWVGKNYGITFTDGTTLELYVRPLAKGERVADQKSSYKTLIRDCAYYNVTSVSALTAARNKPVNS